MDTANQKTNTIVKPIITTIQAGQKISGIIDLYYNIISQIELPRILDGNELTFETSSDGVYFQPLRDINDQKVIIRCTQSMNYRISNDFFPVRFIKIVSNEIENSERIIKLIPKLIVCYKQNERV